MRLISLLLCLLFFDSASGQVTFIINSLPDNHDWSDIFIAGDFNNWSPGNQMHKLQKSGSIYSITIESTMKDINYKFTRGNWDAVETDEWGKDITNRTFHFSKELDTVYIHVETWKDFEQEVIATKSANVETIDDFYMPQLNRTRRIWVYLPPNYSFTNEHYPVIYMHDGQNLFDDATAFAGEWEVDESLDEIYEQTENGFIVIGINNGGEKRIAEYAPWENKEYGGGEGDLYGQFLVERLKPYIDENYRTLVGPENTTIIGSSLGGLISMYVGLKYPKVYGKIGALSPAFWFNPEIFNFIDTVTTSTDIKVYLSAGGGEPGSVESNMNKVGNLLADKGLKHVNLVVHPNQKHNEAYWRSIFPETVSWLEDLPAILSIKKSHVKWFVQDKTFSIRSLLDEDYQVTFFDLTGKVLLSDTINNDKNISLNQVTESIVMVKLANEQYEEVFKVRLK